MGPLHKLGQIRQRGTGDSSCFCIFLVALLIRASADLAIVGDNFGSLLVIPMDENSWLPPCQSVPCNSPNYCFSEVLWCWTCSCSWHDGILLSHDCKACQKTMGGGGYFSIARQIGMMRHDTRLSSWFCLRRTAAAPMVSSWPVHGAWHRALQSFRAFAIAKHEGSQCDCQESPLRLGSSISHEEDL